MLFPVIKIKDGDYVHIVGTNSHDKLYIDKKTGGIQYLNLQCCEGTRKFNGKSSMEFVGKEREWEPDPVIEMVDIEELIKIATENMIDQTDATVRLHENFKQYLEAKGVCKKKLEGDTVTDTGGMLF